MSVLDLPGEGISGATLEGDDGSVFVEENGIKKTFLQGDLVTPCSDLEVYMAKINNYTVTTIWLESDLPLNVDDFRKALRIVSRQIPYLQFCLAKRKNKFWFKRIKNLEIDFEICSKDALEMHHEMLEMKVDLWNGPLWKVRLNPHLTSDQMSCNKRNTGCLSVCVHHSITDATTNMKILRELVFILNKFYLGQDVQPKTVPLLPLSDHFIPDRNFQARSFVFKKMWKNSFRVVRNFVFMSPLKKTVCLPQSVPPSSSISETKVNFGNFTVDDTKLILKRCKANNVTVNSFIITAVNYAVIAVAQKRWHKPIGPRKVLSLQAVDLRRYCGPKYEECSGCYVSYIEGEYKMSSSVSDTNFWHEAKKVHSDVKNRITNLIEPIKNLTLMKLNFNIIPINKFLLSKLNRRLTMATYFATNMGNLDEKLPETKEEDSIGITNLSRSVFYDEYRAALITFTFQTFRGQLMISIDYNSKCMTNETASNFLDTLFQKVKTVIGSENS